MKNPKKILNLLPFIRITPCHQIYFRKNHFLAKSLPPPLASSKLKLHEERKSYADYKKPISREAFSRSEKKKIPLPSSESSLLHLLHAFLPPSKHLVNPSGREKAPRCTYSPLHSLQKRKKKNRKRSLVATLFQASRAIVFSIKLVTRFFSQRAAT